LANICILPAQENREVSDRDPHEYLPKCIATLGMQADQVLNSNLLPPTQAWKYGAGGFEDFVLARSSLISQTVRNLCDGKQPD
jgi:hypothetical protein